VNSVPGSGKERSREQRSLDKRGYRPLAASPAERVTPNSCVLAPSKTSFVLTKARRMDSGGGHRPSSAHPAGGSPAPFVSSDPAGTRISLRSFRPARREVSRGDPGPLPSSLLVGQSLQVLTRLHQTWLRLHCAEPEPGAREPRRPRDLSLLPCSQQADAESTLTSGTTAK